MGRWMNEVAFLFVLNNFGGFLLGVRCRGEGWIWRDWEVSRIGVHYVKFPKNQ